MAFFNPEGLLETHHVEHGLLVTGTDHHLLHLGALESLRRTKRRVYIHYTLKHQSMRHGVAVRRFA